MEDVSTPIRIATRIRVGHCLLFYQAIARWPPPLTVMTSPFT
jgi:hypothetical protein